MTLQPSSDLCFNLSLLHSNVIMRIMKIMNNYFHYFLTFWILEAQPTRGSYTMYLDSNSTFLALLTAQSNLNCRRQPLPIAMELVKHANFADRISTRNLHAVS